MKKNIILFLLSISSGILVATAQETYPVDSASAEHAGVLKGELIKCSFDHSAIYVLIAATYTPGCFEEFVDLVVPELQRRGRYRTGYSGATLRENLLES